VIEETVPVQRIWLDTVEKGEVRNANFALSPTPEIMEVLLGMYLHLTTRVGLAPEAARNQLLCTEPFQNFPEAIAMLGAEGPACGAPP
jgi:hypothetical protein